MLGNRNIILSKNDTFCPNSIFKYLSQKICQNRIFWFFNLCVNSLYRKNNIIIIDTFLVDSTKNIIVLSLKILFNAISEIESWNHTSISHTYTEYSFIMRIMSVPKRPKLNIFL